MVFRIFRQNKQATKWIYILVTLFTMLTFSVTGAVYSWLGDSKAEQTSAGSFVLPSGKKVVIGAEQYRLISQQLNRMNGERFKDSNRVWEFVMLDALAEESGIRVTSEQLSDTVNEFFAQVPADQRQKVYRDVLSRMGMSATEYEALVRRSLRVSTYQALTQSPERFRSDAAFKQLQERGEFVTLDYVTFKDEDFAAKIDKATITDEQLTAHLDTIDGLTRQREYSTPPEYRIDAAYLDVATADPAKLKSLLNEAELSFSDAEIERIYESRKETKYKLPDAPADPNKPADEGATPTDPPKTEPKYKTLEEVKPEIEKEIFAQRVISKVHGELTKRTAEQTVAKLAAEKDGKPAPEAVNLLEELSKQFGLEYIPAAEAPVKWTDLATLPRIGSDRLKQNFETIAKDSALPFMPDEDRPFGFVARVLDKIDPKVLPIAEIREKLVPSYIAAQAQTKAIEASTAFVDALNAAVRPKVQAEIDKIESEAKARATEKATAQNVTDEAAKQKLIDDEVKLVQWRVDGLLKERRHEAFDEVATAQGLTVATVGPFRKDYMQTSFFQSEPKGPQRFLMGQANLFSVPVGKIGDPARDFEGKASYVARVKERRPPEWADLRGNEIDSEKQRFNQMQSMMAQYGMAKPRGAVTYESLALLLNLQREDNAKDEEPSDTP